MAHSKERALRDLSFGSKPLQTAIASCSRSSSRKPLQKAIASFSSSFRYMVTVKRRKRRSTIRAEGYWLGHPAFRWNLIPTSGDFPIIRRKIQPIDRVNRRDLRVSNSRRGPRSIRFFQAEKYFSMLYCLKFPSVEDLGFPAYKLLLTSKAQEL